MDGGGIRDKSACASTVEGFVEPLEGFAEPLEGFVEPLEGFVEPLEGFVEPQAAQNLQDFQALRSKAKEIRC